MIDFKNYNINSFLVVMELCLLHGSGRLSVPVKGGKLALDILKINFLWFFLFPVYDQMLFPLWFLYQMCKLDMKTVANVRFCSVHATALCSHKWQEITDPFMSPEILWHSFSTTDQSKTHHKKPLCSCRCLRCWMCSINKRTQLSFFPQLITGTY